MKSLILFFVILVSFFSYGQNPLIWEKHITKLHGLTAIDNTNSIITCGYYSETFDVDPGTSELFINDLNDMNMFIQKSDSDGNLIWAKTIHSVSNFDIGGIVCDASNNIYLAGDFLDSIDLDPGPNEFFLKGELGDIYILKLTNTGDFVWAKSFGGAYLDELRTIDLDIEKNIIVGGSYKDSLIIFNPNDTLIEYSPPAANTDAFVVKLDSNGVAAWIYSFGGASSSDAVISVATDQNMNVYGTGVYWGTADFDPGPGEAIHTTPGGQDACKFKLDPEGNLIWSQVINSSGGGSGSIVKVDPLGDVIFVGRFADSIDFDPGIGEFYLNCIDYSHDNYIQKLDSDGNFIWARSIGNHSDQDYLYAFDIDAEGCLYIAGSFIDSMDFNPGTDAQIFHVNDSSSIFNPDAYLLKLKSNGDYVWGGTMGGKNYDGAGAIAIDNSDNVILAIVANMYCDVDPNPPLYVINASGIMGVLIKLESDSPFQIEVPEYPNIDLLVYPNPTNGNFTVRINSDQINQSCYLRLFDSSGRIIKVVSAINDGYYSFSNLSLVAGIYYVELVTETENAIVKLVIE